MGIPDETIPTGSEDLACAELRRSPIYNRISENEKRWYVEQSLRIGTDTAEEQLAKGRGLCVLMRENGVEIVLDGSRSAGHGTALRSEIEFNKVRTRITVYEDSIKQIAESCAKDCGCGLRLTRKEVLDMHLAHEFFHYLEFSSGMTTSQRLPKVELTYLGVIKRRIELYECCEVAAQAFSKRFCGLKVLPTYYDLLYLRNHLTLSA